MRRFQHAFCDSPTASANDEWAACRRYMTLEGLAALSHNHTITLPVMVA
ncbi:hypothetical protein [Acidomonas methanolica]|nr:hypothetical protein [Acidomonas methanolica]MCQ9156552.1 hypothetical protein [Acidomonas methanolica]